MSVVIPVFDRTDYLAEAIDSVAAQTVPPDELLVVVDGSTHDLTSVVASCPIPTRVLSRPPGGPGAARNTGSDAATGTVLAYLDADDLWCPEKLEHQLAALARDPSLDMVFCAVEQFFSPELGRAGSPTSSPAAEAAGLLPSTFLVRASAYARVGGFREGVVFGEFIDWYARAVDMGLHGCTIPEAHVRRRVHGHNAGVVLRGQRGDYVRVLKDVLDRRRGQLVVHP